MRTAYELSIIIPVYNTEQYIEDCLNSIINQEGNSLTYEIIIVDDGSTDRSLEIIYAYESKFEKITIISQNNQKQGAARNRGTEISLGNYIWYIDSDDWIRPDAFKVIQGHILAANHFEEIDVIRFGAEDYFDDFRVNKRDNLHLINTLYSAFDALNENKFSVCTPFYLFRRTFLYEKNISFIEGIYFEDNEYIFQVFVNQPNFVSISNVLYCVRIRGNSTTRTTDYFRYHDIAFVVDSVISSILNMKLDAKSKVAISDLVSVNVNNLLYGTLSSRKAFTEGVLLLRNIKGLESIISNSSSVVHKIQVNLFRCPLFLRLVMRIYYKIRSVSNG